MKAPDDIVTDIRRRLDRTWAVELTGVSAAWPHRFAISTPKKSELEAGWTSSYQPLIRQWRDWAKSLPVQLHTEPKRVYITTQDIPTHVEVAELDAAAKVVGDDWPSRLVRARGRLESLTKRYPHTLDLARVVRATDSYSDTDFGLLLATASWFQANDATGLTPRQVPIPGVHAKWLNTRHALISALSGRADLGLLPRHPARIHFTYLDPAYRAAGARLHDSATVGDTFIPPYPPRVVVISENKDTAIHFPPVAGGIAVEGDGFGGKTAAAFPWLTEAPYLYYWGDIDAYGYEILNGWREDGVAVRSILMDLPTYEMFQPYGTNIDRNGVALKPGIPKALPHLTPAECTVYHHLLDPELHGHRRVEQERIPLRFSVEKLTIHAL